MLLFCLMQRSQVRFFTSFSSIGTLDSLYSFLLKSVRERGWYTGSPACGQGSTHQGYQVTAQQQQYNRSEWKRKCLGRQACNPIGDPPGQQGTRQQAQGNHKAG